MSYHKKYKYRLSRGYPGGASSRRQVNLTTIFITGVGGAVIGSFLSVGVIVSIYGNKVQTQPTLSPVSGQALSQTVSAADSPACYPAVEVAKKVGPAVVSIANFQDVDSLNSALGCEDYCNLLSNSLVQIGSGSGFIIDAQNGYIVTNNHVIKGAQKLLVSLNNGKNAYAKFVGADSQADLAVIKISNIGSLTQVELGDSSQLQAGEPVVVIGNSGGEKFAGSVTAGVVSATKRILQGESPFNLIQTDAAINPGNSGGPLVNYQGQVVGINTAKFQQSGIEGIGFAIPITDAWPTIQKLING